MRTSAASLVVGLLLAASAAEVRAEEAETAKATVQTVRNAGVAIMTALAKRVPADTQDPVTPDPFDWAACPAVSYDQLVETIGAQPTADIPRQDGWGNPLEFCLKIDRNAPPATRFVAGIRSPGRNGRFEQSQYKRGPFAFSDFDRDVVWLNGFFFSWPQR